MNRRQQQRIMAVITTITLAFSYLAIGFAVCAGVPFVTESISKSSTAFDTSPYDPASLSTLALETRDYTVSDYGRYDDDEEAGLIAAREALAEKVIAAAHASSDPASTTAERWVPEVLAVLNGEDADGVVRTDYETMLALADVDEAYGFNEETLDHLDDVNELVSKLTFPLLGIAALAAFCFMGSFRLFGVKSAPTPLLASGIVVLAFLILIGLWALVDFQSFFAVLHSLFFAENSWIFPADSLLISLYPESFWTGMGVTWFTISCLLAAISLIAGLALRGGLKRAADSEKELSAPSSHDAVTEPTTSAVE